MRELGQREAYAKPPTPSPAAAIAPRPAEIPVIHGVSIVPSSVQRDPMEEQDKPSIGKCLRLL